MKHNNIYENLRHSGGVDHVRRKYIYKCLNIFNMECIVKLQTNKFSYKSIQILCKYKRGSEN